LSLTAETLSGNWQLWRRSRR